MKKENIITRLAFLHGYLLEILPAQTDYVQEEMHDIICSIQDDIKHLEEKGVILSPSLYFFLSPYTPNHIKTNFTWKTYLKHWGIVYALNLVRLNTCSRLNVLSFRILTALGYLLKVNTLAPTNLITYMN